MDENNKNSDLLQNDAVQDLGATAVTAASGGTIPKPISKMIVKKVANDPKIKEALDRIAMNNMMNSRMNNRKAINNSNQSSSVNNSGSGGSSSESDNANNQGNEEKSNETGKVKLTSAQKKKIFLFLSSPTVIFTFLIIIIIMALIGPVLNTFNFFDNNDDFALSSSDSESKQAEKKYYEKLKKVKENYQAKGVTINTELITATLTYNRDFGDFINNEEFEDDGLIPENTETSDNSPEVNEGEKLFEAAIKKIDLLAKYQIVITKPDYKGCVKDKIGIELKDDSKTPKQIANNDGWFNNEKNYKNIFTYGNLDEYKRCIKTEIPESYSLDNGINGVYYWNLIDEHFIEKYYADSFTGLTEEKKNAKIIEMIEGIYSLANITGGVNSVGSFTPNPGSTIFPLGDGKSCRVRQWSTDDFSHGGKKDKYGNPYPFAIDIAPNVVENSCALANGNCSCPGKGDPILAMTDGTVKFYSSSPGEHGSCFSNGVRILGKIDGVNSVVLYEHLHSYIVSDGQEVKQGQPIGYMGTTGNSTGVHLHVQVSLEENGIMVWQNIDELFKNKFKCVDAS